MPSSSVADKATAPIYYESRIAKLALNASELPKIDEEFDEITEGEEFSKKEKLKTKWAALEALVGDPKRIGLIAADLVAHFEKRVEAMERKPLNKGIFNCLCKAENRMSDGVEGSRGEIPGSPSDLFLTPLNIWLF